MFSTKLDAIENAFLLTVTFRWRVKQWAYIGLDDLEAHRKRVEGYFANGNYESLEEELL